MAVGFAGAFLGGLAALLSPCAAMLLPSFFAYAFGSSRTKLLGRTGLFYVGLLITLVPLGLGQDRWGRCWRRIAERWRSWAASC